MDRTLPFHFPAPLPQAQTGNWRRTLTASGGSRYCYVKVVSQGFVEATVLSGSLFRHACFAKTLIELLDMSQVMVGPREGSPLGDGSAFGTNSAR
jgi:hypothetical protein